MKNQIIQEAVNNAQDVSELEAIPELTNITDIILSEDISDEELGELLCQ